jgi:iron-sulfur cluster repair protein YtfE (RIC family)
VKRPRRSTLHDGAPKIPSTRMSSEAGTLVRLGRRPPPGDSAVGLLLDCHGRIRTFSDLAVRLARADASDHEIRDAAARVHRYFTVALPLHVADEDETLQPRLASRAPDLLAALDIVTREHREAEEWLTELQPIWEALARDPAQAALRLSTATPAGRLQGLLERHLLREEEQLFPALTQVFSPAEERAIVEEFRARRAPR